MYCTLNVTCRNTEINYWLLEHTQHELHYIFLDVKYLDDIECLSVSITIHHISFPTASFAAVNI
jgi:hypothetical protein